MEVILDELTPVEFFKHGGIVKVTINNDDIIKECNLKKKYTFFDNKSYNRFFRNLYIVYFNRHPGENYYAHYKFINNCVELNPSIGNSIYVTDLDYDNTMSYETAKFYYSGDRKEQEIMPRDPYGIKNVCFSQVDETSNDWNKFKKQRLSRGFDDSELWSLDGTISKFIYPRLSAFLEYSKNVKLPPFDDMTHDEWCDILEKMVDGFKLLSFDRMKSEEELEIEENALKLFCKYFFCLWE